MSNLIDQNEQMAFGRTQQVCKSCVKPKPLDAFRYLGQLVGGKRVRISVCNECESAHRKDGSQRAVVTKKRNEMSLVVKQLATARHNVPHIGELTEKMLATFKGVDGFAAFWKSQIDISALQRPGGKNTLDACAKLANMVMQTTQLDQSATPVKELTDADLDLEAERLALAVLRRNPGVLRDMAESLGMTLVRKVDVQMLPAPAQQGRDEMKVEDTFA